MGKIFMIGNPITQEDRNILKDIEKEDEMARGRGACGGKRKLDGSGGGTGNRGTARQPRKKKRGK